MEAEDLFGTVVVFVVGSLVVLAISGNITPQTTDVAVNIIIFALITAVFLTILDEAAR